MRSWDVLVTEGRDAVRVISVNKWKLGDLALEVLPVGDDRANNGTLGRLERFADEIGIEFEALRKYRTVAHTWPDGTRVPCASWTAHRECMANPDVLLGLAQRYNPVLMRHVREALGKAPARGPDETRYGFTNLPAEERAALVGEAIHADADVRVAARKALAEHDQERYDRRPEPIERSESSAYGLLVDFRNLHRTVERIAHRVTRAGATGAVEQRDELLQEVDWLRNALSMIEDGLRLGSLDAALARILAEG